MNNTSKTYMYSTYIPRPTYIRRNNNNELHTEKGNSQGIYNPNNTLQDYIIVGLAIFSAFKTGANSKHQKGMSRSIGAEV